MSERDEKMTTLVRELSAQFLASASNRTSLITVTRANVSKDFKRATIFVTVLPEGKEKPALEFLKRNRGDLREFLKKNMNTRTVPFIEIELDYGEKNRQRVDELLRNS